MGFYLPQELPTSQVVIHLPTSERGDKLTISRDIVGDSSLCRGSASMSVEIVATTMKEPREIGFYGPQILDILKSLRGRQVRVDLFDVGGPNNFVGDRIDSHALNVIMTVRL